MKFNPDLANNPEPRCPCLLVLDVSGSMAGNRITELNAGLELFRRELLNDPLASKRVESAVITFGGEARIAQPFVTARQMQSLALTADGNTPMGEALTLAFDLLEQRKVEYKENGIAFYRPWVFLITDGAPTDSWQQVAERARTGQLSKQWQLFAVGVEGADFTTLKALSVGEPLQLKGLAFRELFLWLSASQMKVSKSRIGENVELENPTAPNGWGSIPTLSCLGKRLPLVLWALLTWLLVRHVRINTAHG